MTVRVMNAGLGRGEVVEPQLGAAGGGPRQLYVCEAVFRFSFFIIIFTPRM